MAATAIALWAFQGLPRCTSVDPLSGKAGDTITAKGENLKNIAEAYLTDGQKDTRIAMTEATDAEFKFKVPEMKAGRYRLLFLSGNRASLVEQPVLFTVE
jgi:hypothetical protein